MPITVADAETITSYEAGIKADLFNRRAPPASSVYDYDVKNQQLTVVGGNSNVNQADQRRQDQWPRRRGRLRSLRHQRLQVTAGGSYNFTEIKDPTLSVNKCAQCTITDPINAAGRVVIDGNPLPQAPKSTLNAIGPLPVEPGRRPALRPDRLVSTAARSTSSCTKPNEFTGKPLTEGGLRVGYIFGNGKYEVAAFGRNIGDTRRITGAIDFNNLTGFTNEPRVLGRAVQG